MSVKQKPTMKKNLQKILLGTFLKNKSGDYY